jgi:hypothetical protein
MKELSILIETIYSKLIFDCKIRSRRAHFYWVFRSKILTVWSEKVSLKTTKLQLSIDFGYIFMIRMESSFILKHYYWIIWKKNFLKFSLPFPYSPSGCSRVKFFTSIFLRTFYMILSGTEFWFFLDKIFINAEWFNVLWGQFSFWGSIKILRLRTSDRLEGKLFFLIFSYQSLEN